MTKQITEDMAGCWLDSHWGWMNNYRVVERAQEWGFELDSDDERLLSVYRLNDDEEAVVNFLLQERLGYPKERGGEEIIGFDALHQEARSLIENAADAVLGQGGLSGKATEYLDSLAPDGMAFHWDDGLALMCLCQIEGTEENGELMKTDKYYCERCEGRCSK